MYLLFLSSLLAVVVILAITLKDQFGHPKPQPEPEEAAPAASPVMTSAETQA